MATPEDPIISPETSKRICAHMNDDHAVSVYAMAKRLLSGGSSSSITQSKLTQVTSAACHLQVVTCSGDVCEMHRLEYPLQPPLASAGEARSRLVSIHQTVCAPSWSWLFTKPLAVAVLLGTLGMIYVSHIDRTILPHPDVASLLYLTVVAHMVEVGLTVRSCRVDLKLPWATTLSWVVLVMITGIAIYSELQDLQRHVVGKEGKKKH